MMREKEYNLTVMVSDLFSFFNLDMLQWAEQKHLLHATWGLVLVTRFKALKSS